MHAVHRIASWFAGEYRNLGSWGIGAQIRRQARVERPPGQRHWRKYREAPLRGHSVPFILGLS